MKGGTLSLSWGENGGLYTMRRHITRLGLVWRICIWRVALTYVPIEIDDLMKGYADSLTTKED